MILDVSSQTCNHVFKKTFSLSEKHSSDDKWKSFHQVNLTQRIKRWQRRKLQLPLGIRTCQTPCTTEVTFHYMCTINCESLNKSMTIPKGMVIDLLCKSNDNMTGTNLRRRVGSKQRYHTLTTRTTRHFSSNWKQCHHLLRRESLTKSRPVFLGGRG